jgi:hypothetical protein
MSATLVEKLQKYLEQSENLRLFNDVSQNHSILLCIAR